jgi:ubiquinone/menaquinone biosynthesis C-methylase UbiE
MKQTGDHYSYRIYADPEVARSFDADRFGGPIGNLIKETQEAIVFSNLPNVQGWNVLDLGAGTGRLSMAFLQRGADVTACDASPQMLEILKSKTSDPRLKVMVADAHELQFRDRQFDCAVSFRMLLHVLNWQKSLAELCRVSKDWVVFDFSPKHGFLLAAPLLHSIHRLIKGAKMQSYKTFPLKTVKQELEKNQFEVSFIDLGYVLPLMLHRTLGSPSFTRASEALFSKLKLDRIFGSPLTVFARRKK